MGANGGSACSGAARGTVGTTAQAVMRPSGRGRGSIGATARAVLVGAARSRSSLGAKARGRGALTGHTWARLYQRGTAYQARWRAGDLPIAQRVTAPYRGIWRAGWRFQTFIAYWVGQGAAMSETVNFWTKYDAETLPAVFDYSAICNQNAVSLASAVVTELTTSGLTIGTPVVVNNVWIRVPISGGTASGDPDAPQTYVVRCQATTSGSPASILDLNVQITMLEPTTV